MIIVGHRGAMSTVLENTLPSFLAAEHIGVDALELDIHSTSDGRLAVIHDARATRVAAHDSLHRDTPIQELTWDQVAEINLRDGGRIPELVEVLDATTAALQIEIKAPGAVTPLIELLRTRAEDLARITVTTFQDELLRQVAAADLGVGLGIIRSKHDPERMRILDDTPGLTSYFPGREGVDKQLVERLHRRGLIVGVWPVATQAELQEAQELGVDVITVDDPAPFVAATR